MNNFYDRAARDAAKLANDGVLELYERQGKVLGELEELRRRVEELEDAARPSRVDGDLEDRLTRLLDARLTSSPPSSTAEVRTAAGNRVRAPVWAAIVLALIVLAIALVWQGPELVKAVR